MVNKKVDTKKPRVGIPIEWYVPETLMTPFATNMVVQGIENFFF